MGKCSFNPHLHHHLHLVLSSCSSSLHGLKKNQDFYLIFNNNNVSMNKFYTLTVPCMMLEAETCNKAVSLRSILTPQNHSWMWSLLSLSSCRTPPLQVIFHVFLLLQFYSKTNMHDVHILYNIFDIGCSEHLIYQTV